MKNLAAIIGIFAFIFSAGIVISCSSNSDMEYAKVKILTGLDNEKEEKSISKAEAPGAITSMEVAVTAPDIAEISNEIPLDTGELELSIPAGAARQFSVRAETNTEVFYEGSTTIDVKPNTNTSVLILMVQYIDGSSDQPLSPVADLRLEPDSHSANIDFGQTDDVNMNAWVYNDAYDRTLTLDWEIYDIEYAGGYTDWLIAVPSEGTALDGRSFQLLSYTIDSSVISSTSGDHTATITFRNQDNNSDTDSEVVTVTVGLEPAHVTIDFANDPTTAISSYSVTAGGSPISGFTAPGDTVDIIAETETDIIITAFVDTTNPGDTAIRSWQGSVTEDLTPGQIIAVSVPMSVYETKIIVPDYSNNRIVQVDSIGGAGWTDVTGDQIAAMDDKDPFSMASDFRPYDVEIDLSGRIYIANNGTLLTGRNCIIRMNNITGANFLLFDDATDDYLVSLALDTNNNYVYYATQTQLYRSNYVGAAVKGDFNMGSITTINGIDVDDSGFVYIAGQILGVGSIVAKYDPALETMTYTTTDLNTPMDVIAKSSYVYVANRYGLADYKIIQLDQNLSQIANFGSAPPTVQRVGQNQFWGPMRFVATLNRRFYIIDENLSFVDESLTTFSDMSGAGWGTLYGEDMGETGFDFFWNC